jgi:MFS family permease
VALVLGGRLGDKYGRRNLFVVGAAGFTLASLACATAQDSTFLIAARAAQGFLGALLIPQGFGIMREVFPPQDLGKAFASFGPVIGLSAVGGPLLGGVLVDADLFGLGWRIVFFVNLPIGLAALAGALRFIPKSARNPRLRLDPLGVGLLAAASLLLIYPLIQGHDLDWPWWTFVSMAASLPAFGLFAWYERGGKAPLIEPSLLRNRAYLGGLAVIMLSFGAMIGFTLVFNVFAQAVLGFSPLRTAFAGCRLRPRHGHRGRCREWPGAEVRPEGVEHRVRRDDPWRRSAGADGGVGRARRARLAVPAGTLFFELLPDGPVRAMEITTIVAAGFLVGALVLVRLLPKRPRLDQAH